MTKPTSTVLTFLLSLSIPLSSSALAIHTTNTTTPTWWKPLPGATWNIDLSTNPTTFSLASKTLIYDLDLFDTSASTISSLHAAGHKVICYYSAGSWENWRPDASSFPKAALGNALDGWAGEYWLDTRDAQVRQLMAARVQLAQSKGCDGVDPDNIDGYENNPGFLLTYATAIDYVTFLANTAHNFSMASGLKNGGDIVPSVVNVTDFEVNESCAVYSECSDLQPFVDAGKPVFHIEYTAAATPAAKFVAKSCGTKGFSSVIKHLALGTWTASCPNGTVVAF